MSERGQPDLEESLRAALRSLAPEPGADVLDRALEFVAETTQRPRSRPWLRWPIAATSAAIAIAGTAVVVTGLLLGPNFGPPGVSDAPPVAPGTWERFVLPDPLTGEFAFARATANDAALLDGTYVLVGSFHAHCHGHEVDPAPPGCDSALEALPGPNSTSPGPYAAVVWLSDDARSWELLPHQEAFDGAAMEHIATDGVRLVASGFLHRPGGVNAMVWISEDGRRWEAVGPGGLLPHQLVWTRAGFIGARTTPDGPQFMASDDGRSWRALSEPGEHGAGEVRALSVGLDGTTVVATGLSRDGAVNWYTLDGDVWDRGLAPAPVDHLRAVYGITPTDSGWVAVGHESDAWGGSSSSAVWTSTDARTWTRVATSLPGQVSHGDVVDVAWTGDEVVAVGSLGAVRGPSAAMWVSPDGVTWARAEDQPTLAGHPASPGWLVAFDGWILGLSSTTGRDDHMIGVVWIGAP